MKKILGKLNKKFILESREKKNYVAQLENAKRVD